MEREKLSKYLSREVIVLSNRKSKIPKISPERCCHFCSNIFRLIDVDKM